MLFYSCIFFLFFSALALSFTSTALAHSGFLDYSQITSYSIAPLATSEEFRPDLQILLPFTFLSSSKPIRDFTPHSRLFSWRNIQFMQFVKVYLLFLQSKPIRSFTPTYKWYNLCKNIFDEEVKTKLVSEENDA